MEYIKVYERALDANFCDRLVKLFDNSSDDHFDGYMGENKYINHELKKCKEMYVKDIDNNLISNVVENLFNKYIQEVGYIGGQFKVEDYRIKKYISDGSEFYKWHVDVTTIKNSSRAVAIIFYLNNVEDGGETGFKLGDKTIRIKPQKCNALIFPANFCFPHCGFSPISNDKYILTTFVRYA